MTDVRNEGVPDSPSSVWTLISPSVIYMHLIPEEHVILTCTTRLIVGIIGVAYYELDALSAVFQSS